jgi:ribosomal protein S18 acetylase RimI-like enzyme
MVQTSLAAWLKTVQPRKDNTILIKPNIVEEEEPQAAKHMSKAEELQQAEIQELENEDTTLKANAVKSLAQKSSSLPPNATLSAITADTLPSFRRMTAILLPVPYPEKFYNDILNDKIAAKISMVALWADSTNATKPRVVSGIRCRLLASAPGGDDNDPSLYISTITTLAPFRGHGLAGALLQCVIARAIREYGITTVTAHMWEANEDAREWYSKHGFKEIHYDPKYYRKLKPGGAYLLERKIGPQDLLGVNELDEG